MALFTTTLDLYGGVLWSGELQGFIIHQTMPNASASALHIAGACRTRLPADNVGHVLGLGLGGWGLGVGFLPHPRRPRQAGRREAGQASRFR